MNVTDVQTLIADANEMARQVEAAATASVEDAHALILSAAQIGCRALSSHWLGQAVAANGVLASDDSTARTDSPRPDTEALGEFLQAESDVLERLGASRSLVEVTVRAVRDAYTDGRVGRRDPENVRGYVEALKQIACTPPNWLVASTPNEPEKRHRLRRLVRWIAVGVAGVAVIAANHIAPEVLGPEFEFLREPSTEAGKLILGLAAERATSEAG